jgi:hypothetical protein
MCWGMCSMRRSHDFALKKCTPHIFLCVWSINDGPTRVEPNLGRSIFGSELKTFVEPKTDYIES